MFNTFVGINGRMKVYVDLMSRLEIAVFVTDHLYDAGMFYAHMSRSNGAAVGENTFQPKISTSATV